MPSIALPACGRERRDTGQHPRHSKTGREFQGYCGISKVVHINKRASCSLEYLSLAFVGVCCVKALPVSREEPWLAHYARPNRTRLSGNGNLRRYTSSPVVMAC